MAEAGAPVKLEEWDGVLHAWHTFFPLMPRANEAVDHVAAFVREALGLAPPQPPVIEIDMEAERQAAAIKLQAMQRGRNSRRKVVFAPSNAPKEEERGKGARGAGALLVVHERAPERGPRRRSTCTC